MVDATACSLKAAVSNSLLCPLSQHRARRSLQLPRSLKQPVPHKKSAVYQQPRSWLDIGPTEANMAARDGGTAQTLSASVQVGTTPTLCISTASLLLDGDARATLDHWYR